MSKLKELLESILECGYICPYGTTNIDCDDCLDKILEEHNAEIRRQTIDEFISKAELERIEIYNWDDDDYENGKRCGYEYSIEIAEKMKGETDGD